MGAVWTDTTWTNDSCPCGSGGKQQRHYCSGSGSSERPSVACHRCTHSACQRIACLSLSAHAKRPADGTGTPERSSHLSNAYPISSSFRGWPTPGTFSLTPTFDTRQLRNQRRLAPNQTPQLLGIRTLTPTAKTETPFGTCQVKLENNFQDTLPKFRYFGYHGLGARNEWCIRFCNMQWS